MPEMCDLCKRCLARTPTGMPAFFAANRNGICRASRQLSWVVPPVSAQDLAFYTSGCRQPGPSPACCVPRKRQTGKWWQSAARTRRAGAQEVAQRRLRQPAGRHVETECSGRKEFNAGASERASASVREDRPHREPVPARQVTPCQPTCSTRRNLPVVVVVRRSGSGARAQNAKNQRRARQRTGRFGNGMQLLRPDDLLFDASWPSRPGCDGQRCPCRWHGRQPPSPPAAGIRQISLHQEQGPFALSRPSSGSPAGFFADDGTPTPSPFTRAQPAA